MKYFFIMFVSLSVSVGYAAERTITKKITKVGLLKAEENIFPEILLRYVKQNPSLGEVNLAMLLAERYKMPMFKKESNDSQITESHVSDNKK